MSLWADCVVEYCTWLQLSSDSEESPLQADVKAATHCSDIIDIDDDDDDDFVGMCLHQSVFKSLGQSVVM